MAKTIERTVYNALTQEANSTIVRVPGTVGIKKGVIDVFFPDVRKGRVEYRLVDHTGKVTTFPVDTPWETAEGVKVTLLPNGITPGHQFAEVDCSGSVGLLGISVVLNDWTTDFESLEETVADHETRIAALEEPKP